MSRRRFLLLLANAAGGGEGGGIDYGETIHYDIGQLEGLVDGNSITSVPNLTSPGTYDLVPYTTGGAIYKTAIVNSLPVLRMSRLEAHRMKIDGYLPGNSAIAESTIVVVSQSRIGLSHMVATNPGGTTTGFVFRYNSAIQLALYNMHVTAPNSLTHAVTDQFNVIFFRKAGLVYDIGANNTTSTGATMGGYNVSVGTYTQIGVQDTSITSTNWADCDIAEMYIFDSALSNETLGTLITELKTKYAIA